MAIIIIISIIIIRTFQLLPLNLTSEGIPMLLPFNLTFQLLKR